MTWHGKRRERGANGQPDRAWVESRDGDNGFYVIKDEYWQGPYTPLWDDLPWAGE